MFTIPVGRATEDNKALFRVVDPGTSEGNVVRLMMCDHINDAGHRAVVAPLQRLQGYCCWFCMETESVMQRYSIHCMNSKAGERVPRPLEENMHGTGPGKILYFNHLYVGDSGTPGKVELDEGDGFKYILVMIDELSSFVWLEPTASCTAASTMKHLLRWCKTLGVPN